MGNSKSKMIMAQSIKNNIKQRNLTQKKVCFDLGIKPTTLSDWVHGKTYPRIENIEKLAQYFGVSVSDMMEDSVNSSDTEINLLTIYTKGKKLTYALSTTEMQQVSAFLETIKKQTGGSSI